MSGFLPACCLDQLADLSFPDSFSISVFELNRSKATPFAVKFSADEMKPQEAHKDVGSCPITRYAVRLDPVDRITLYSGIVRGLAPIQAELQAQMRADDQTGIQQQTGLALTVS